MNPEGFELKGKRAMKMLHAKRILGMVGNSFDDYAASRLLFRNGMLLQASILACTCIEKYFKAILLVSTDNLPRKHDLLKLSSLLSNTEHTHVQKLNMEFLDVLTRAYKARYVGDLEPGFNITLLQRKFLAELDYSYSVLAPSLQFKHPGSEDFSKSKYDDSAERKDPHVCLDNYVLAGVDKTAFVEQRDVVYEMRIHESGALYEVGYPTTDSKNDGKFTYPAQVFDNDKPSARMSHKLADGTYAEGEGGVVHKVK